MQLTSPLSHGLHNVGRAVLHPADMAWRAEGKLTVALPDAVSELFYTAVSNCVRYRIWALLCLMTNKAFSADQVCNYYSLSY